jgi:hypothetical protein
VAAARVIDLLDTSSRPKSVPPTTDIRTPFARFLEEWSKSGLFNAAYSIEHHPSYQHQNVRCQTLLLQHCHITHIHVLLHAHDLFQLRFLSYPASDTVSSTKQFRSPINYVTYAIVALLLRAIPLPIKPQPGPLVIVCTSAKSRLINPGCTSTTSSNNV